MFPLVQSFQSTVETAREEISQEFYTHSVCLVCFMSALLSLRSLLPYSPFLYLSLTKSLLCLFCWGLRRRETEWQRGVRVCRRCIQLSYRERVWPPKTQRCFPPTDHHWACFWRGTVHLIFLMGLKLKQTCFERISECTKCYGCALVKRIQAKVMIP